jgi:hypothetical protein
VGARAGHGGPPGSRPCTPSPRNDPGGVGGSTRAGWLSCSG